MMMYLKRYAYDIFPRNLLIGSPIIKEKFWGDNLEKEIYKDEYIYMYVLTIELKEQLSVRNRDRFGIIQRKGGVSMCAKLSQQGKALKPSPLRNRLDLWKLQLVTYLGSVRPWFRIF